MVQTLEDTYYFNYEHFLRFEEPSIFIFRIGPLENNHNTILVVGGVHWLATHHLSVIKKALEREGLDRIRVVMKSLGAGFHQPVDGLHCLPLVSDTLIVMPCSHLPTTTHTPILYLNR